MVFLAPHKRGRERGKQRKERVELLFGEIAGPLSDDLAGPRSEDGASGMNNSIRYRSIARTFLLTRRTESDPGLASDGSLSNLESPAPAKPTNALLPAASLLPAAAPPTVTPPTAPSYGSTGPVELSLLPDVAGQVAPTCIDPWTTPQAAHPSLFPWDEAWRDTELWNMYLLGGGWSTSGGGDAGMGTGCTPVPFDS